MTVCLSPNGPTVTQLRAAPTRLVVATIEGVGVFERVHARGPWTGVARALRESHVSSLAWEPDRGGLFAGAHSGGLYFSADGGVGWERRSRGLAAEHVFCVATAKAATGTAIYAGTEPVSLFRSLDEGRSWVDLAAIRAVPGQDKWWFPPPPHTAHLKSLAFDERDPCTFYACIEQGALLKTTDGGESWRELDSYYRPDDPWYRDIHRVVPMPRDPDELFMTSGMGLYHSRDAGERWEKLSGTDFRLGYPDHFVVSPDDDNVLFMSGATQDPSRWRTSHMAGGTVMKSTDRGRTWKLADNGLPVSGRVNIEAMCMAVWPGGWSLFAANTDGEVYESDDGAGSWRLAARGLAPVSKVGHYKFLQVA
jgi:photosystem II stability/assembly factor-like uncharacterized protein